MSKVDKSPDVYKSPNDVNKSEVTWTQESEMSWPKKSSKVTAKQILDMFKDPQIQIESHIYEWPKKDMARLENLYKENPKNLLKLIKLIWDWDYLTILHIVDHSQGKISNNLVKNIEYLVTMGFRESKEIWYAEKVKVVSKINVNNIKKVSSILVKIWFDPEKLTKSIGILKALSETNVALLNKKIEYLKDQNIENIPVMFDEPSTLCWYDIKTLKCELNYYKSIESIFEEKWLTYPISKFLPYFKNISKNRPYLKDTNILKDNFEVLEIAWMLNNENVWKLLNTLDWVKTENFETIVLNAWIKSIDEIKKLQFILYRAKPENLKLIVKEWITNVGELLELHDILRNENTTTIKSALDKLKN